MSSFDTIIGTTDGVFRLTNGDLTPIGLSGQRIWAIHALRDASGNDAILAGSYGDGMFRSPDGGRTWDAANDGLSSSAFRVILPDPLESSALLAGTEPGRIYRSTDDGQSWNELDGITDIDGHDAWYLPYSPRAGAVRNIYAPDPNGTRLLASVEVGGLLDSPDGGVTWTCAQVDIDDDIHHITGHPTDPRLLFASLGYASLKDSPHRIDGSRFGGIARSRDGGATWQKVESHYTRATIIPPTRPDLLLAGPAPDVGESGRIVVSTDWGATWLSASHGIDTPMPDMVELFVPSPDNTIYAICSGGRLLVAEPADPGNWHWRSVLPDHADIKVQSVSFLTR